MVQTMHVFIFIFLFSEETMRESEFWGRRFSSSLVFEHFLICKSFYSKANLKRNSVKWSCFSQCAIFHAMALPSLSLSPSPLDPVSISQVPLPTSDRRHFPKCGTWSLCSLPFQLNLSKERTHSSPPLNLQHTL